jgi:hypothetical protein
LALSRGVASIVSGEIPTVAVRYVQVPELTDRVNEETAGRWGNAYGEIALWQKLALWAGESPQFVGLDQVNVNFPTCSTTVRAAVEARYDAFMTFTSAETEFTNTVRIYVPFIISVGEPRCQ